MKDFIIRLNLANLKRITIIFFAVPYRNKLDSVSCND